MSRAVRNGSKEQYWRKILARWQTSGLTVRAYCEAHSLSQPSFYWWRREIQRRVVCSPIFGPARVGVSSAIQSPVQ